MAKNMLNDVALRNAKPAEKDKRLNDGEGLYLLIKPKGATWWRFDYRFDGKPKMLSLGVYPKVSLAIARNRADEEERALQMGWTPAQSERKPKPPNNKL